MNFNHIHTTTKTYIVLLFIAIILLFFTTGKAYKQIMLTEKSAEMVVHTLEIYNVIGDLTAHAAKGDSENFQDFLIKKKPSRVSFDAYKLEGKYIINRLKNLVKDSDFQLTRVNNLGGLLDTLYSQINVLENVNFKNSNELNLLHLSHKNKINKTIREIGVIKNQMLEFEERLMLERKADYSFHKSLTPRFILLLAFFALVVFIISFFRIYTNKLKIRKSESFLKSVLATTDNIVNYYEPIFDNVNQIINFKIIFANNCNRDYLGLHPDFIVGKNVLGLYPLHKNTEELEELIQSYNDNTKVIFDRQITVDQKTMYFHSIITPLAEGVLVTSRNSTSDVEAEEMLRKNNLELKNRNAELESFNRVVSHDLQEPLRKIYLFSLRIEEVEADNFSEKSKEYFEKVTKAVARMQSLIHNLLAYSRIDSSKKNFEKIDLNEVLAKTQEDLSTSILDSNTTIIADNLPKIKGVVFQMEQLFTNLISNAIKYKKVDVAPQIQIYYSKIAASELPTELLKSCKEYHKICFIDNGIGFKQVYSEKIFEVFQRLHQKTEYSGTGIGLAICKKILENHNGYIDAIGKENVGSEFIIYLPVI